MPHLRFRATSAAEVRELSSSLPKELAAAMQTSEDNFTFELVNTQYFASGQETPSYPFVEVLWFERPQEVQDRCAVIITEKVNALGAYEDVVVVFQVLPKASYYENARHF
ncbi:DUF1904 domain-containing protein [Bdellovibrio sp. 22V]|uniref:DUF1904 domain-containing protein n=1 Tax=Bdellovibrio TaxID=958 RepID=UPI0025436D51|nr:DUF1904 domain-containing protein [Bdellovibrio sp. 22V]WII71020.1 DUF1904 domain-containing protein [Bdellovibrio sp. 22V]